MLIFCIRQQWLQATEQLKGEIRKKNKKKKKTVVQILTNSDSYSSHRIPF